MRLKVISLAIVALFLILTIIYTEYSNIQTKYSDAKRSFLVVDKISLLTQIIHPLQKERGLTATNLITHDKVIQNKLLKQRKETDLYLAKALESFGPKSKNDINNFIIILDNLRSRVDEDNSNWKEIKLFYTSQINYFLNMISLELAEFKHDKDVGHQLYGVLYLAIVREHLGLLRATLSRGYQRGEVIQKELLVINQEYSGFNNSFNSFKLHMKKSKSNNWLIKTENDVLVSIRKQIEHVLKESKEKPKGSTVKWWNETTLALDMMKEVEEEMKDYVNRSSHQLISDLEQERSTYLIISFFVFLLIAWVTIITVSRILKVLSILIKSLKQIVKNEDFSLRIKSNPQDDFKQLSFSINQLLNYTDGIIKEKDMIASIDVLTGVMNRRSFINVAKEEIERHKRYERPLSLIFCDIDKFKLINDKYGHALGDEVLKAFAKNIQSHLRKSDYFARWGGEEFIILSPDTKEEGAIELAENIRKLIMTLSVSSINNITCSFGVAQMKKDETLEQLCERADKAVYKAKESGRNQVSICNEQ
jgi:diguanylate cyclase (GGDEF)-like protein